MTGAGGYIGRRLVPALVAAGHEVRVGFRDPPRALERTWHEQVEPVALDVTDEAAVALAVDGVDAVCYLVHGMGGRDFAETDRLSARLLVDAGAGAADRGRGCGGCAGGRAHQRRWSHGPTTSVATSSAIATCSGSTRGRGPDAPPGEVPLVPSQVMGHVAGVLTDLPASTVRALVECLHDDMVCDERWPLSGDPAWADGGRPGQPAAAGRVDGRRGRTPRVEADGPEALGLRP